MVMSDCSFRRQPRLPVFRATVSGVFPIAIAPSDALATYQKGLPQIPSDQTVHCGSLLPLPAILAEFPAFQTMVACHCGALHSYQFVRQESVTRNTSLQINALPCHAIA
jgi:hypothetical protein